MICPHCNTTMREITKTAVVIDLCPTCKGVWLDRGELEKVLSRAREVEREWEDEYRRPERRSYDLDDEHYPDRRYSGDGKYRKKRPWTELFDIFD